MKHLLVLRQQRSDLIKEGGTIVRLAEMETRGLNETEGARIDDIDKKIRALDVDITRIERQVELERSAPGNDDQRQLPGNGDPSKARTFKSMGEQLRAIVQAGTPGFRGGVDSRLIPETRAASGLSGSVPSDGGFFIQNDFSAELLKKTYEMGAVSSRVRRIPISANSNGLKINAVDESSRATGSRWGGIQVYWANEADVFTATKPKFRQMELKLNKLTGLCYLTDELMEDAAALEGILMEAFPEEMNFTVENAIVNGVGAGQPLGYTAGSAVVSVAKEAGQAGATLQVENIVKMWSRMWGRSRLNSVWLINQDIEPQLFTMGVVVGTGGVPVYMPPGGVSGSPYSQLMGRPVIPVEYCATLGTVGDIQLVDLSQYLMIDKGGIESESSIHVRFLYDEMTLRFTYRCDGQPIWNKALTPKNGSNTLSPFVTLATRA